jgi:ABC-type sugar transport system substrate-binding protein
MKRKNMVFTGLLMILYLVLGVSTISSAGQQEKVKDDGQIVIGWAMAYFDHPVYQLLMEGAEDVAAEEGVKLIFADGKNDAAIQATQIDNFIAQRFDAIILTPTVADPLIPSVKKINNAGIPLILVDRLMYKQGQDIHWDAVVSWDMALSGTYGGEQVVEAIDGRGKVVVVEGTAGAGSTIERGGAFYKVLENYPEIEVIYKVDGDFTRAKGMEVTESILQRYKPGDFDAIYYMNDEMTLGGLQAIEDAGRLGEFKIISVDGEKEMLDELRAGKIDYECMFFPDEQAVGVSVAAALARGETPDYSNINYKGTPIEVVELDGVPWIRPTVYKVDKSNAFEPEFIGW